jgi:Family of unknown function (DUF5336)
LTAGVSLLPKQKALPALVAVLSVLAFLLVIAIVLTAPDGVSIDWGLYLIIGFTVIQAIVAVAVLLFDAGVITPPAPKPPQYDQQYGQYGGPGAPYYGQLPHGGPPQHQQQQVHAQRRQYPSPYGGGYPGGGPPTTSYAGGQQSGPATPPTGFPTYGQPPSNPVTTREAPMPTQTSASSPQSEPEPS